MNFEEAKKKLKKVPQEEIHIVESFSGIDNEIVELFPGLFIGSIHSANNHEHLIEKKIKHILTVSQEERPQEIKEIQYYWIPFYDNNCDILLLLPKCFDIIDKALSDKENILVHCLQGISRSGSVCCAYVMKQKKQTFLDTWSELKKKRSVIHPNEYFKGQLKEFEQSIL